MCCQSFVGGEDNVTPSIATTATIVVSFFLQSQSFSAGDVSQSSTRVKTHSFVRFWP